MDVTENDRSTDSSDLKKLKVVDLKDLLKKRGISSDGYLKDELRTMTKTALDLYEEKEADDEEIQSAKRRKVTFDKETIAN